MILRETLFRFGDAGGDEAISLTLAGSGPSADSGGVRLSRSISSIFVRTGTASVLVPGPTTTKFGAKAAFFLSDWAYAGFFWTRLCFIRSGKPSG